MHVVEEVEKVEEIEEVEEVQEVEDVEESLTMFPATSCGEQCSLVSLGTPKSEVHAATFQEKAGYMSSYPCRVEQKTLMSVSWRCPPKSAREDRSWSISSPRA